MANTFVIAMSSWIIFNILFVAMRLWVTRPQSWRAGVFFRQLSTVRVKSRLRRHARRPFRTSLTGFGARSGLLT